MFTVGDSVAKFLANIFQSDGIVSFHDRTGFQQAVNQYQRGSFADVVCARFEAQPPDRDRPPVQITAKVVPKLAKEHMLLLVVRFIDRSQNPRFNAAFRSQ